MIKLIVTFIISLNFIFQRKKSTICVCVVIDYAHIMSSVHVVIDYADTRISVL